MVLFYLQSTGLYEDGKFHDRIFERPFFLFDSAVPERGGFAAFVVGIYALASKNADKLRCRTIDEYAEILSIVRCNRPKNDVAVLGKPPYNRALRFCRVCGVLRTRTITRTNTAFHRAGDNCFVRMLRKMEERGTRKSRLRGVSRSRVR